MQIKEGFVLVRNPYYPEQVTKYLPDPGVVDLIAFCSKNPRPMLPHLNILSAFDTFRFVTITPYGKDVEPGVPDKTPKAYSSVIANLAEMSFFPAITLHTYADVTPVLTANSACVSSLSIRISPKVSPG